MPLQVRRGTTAERGTITPLVGELIYDTQEGKLYVGDGTTAGGVPASAYSDDDAQDAVFAAINHGDHTGISFTYNDTANKITAIVNPDLTNYEGVIGADGFKGSLFADDSTLVFNAATGTVSANFRGDLMGSVFADNSTILIDGVLAAFNLDGTVRTNVIPAVNEVYDLGSSGARFKDIYLSGTSIFLGNATITATGSAVNLPVGSTVGGVPIGSGSGTGDGVIAGSNYNINIVGDDSTLIVDVANKVLTGNLVGNVTGNVTGNLDGLVIGQRSGNPGQTLLDNVSSTLDINNISCDFVSAIQMNVQTIFSSFVGDIKGSLFAEDSGIMVDTIDRKLYGDLVGNVTGDVTGNLAGNIIGQRSTIPGQVLLDVAASNLSVNNIDCDAMVGIINGLPGSSMVGDLIGNTDGYHTGPVKGSIFADNSTVLIESDTGRHYGTFVGNVIGNVLGDISGNVFGTLLGNVTGNVSGDLTGSVFADDSSTIINSATKDYTNGFITINDNRITVDTTDTIEFGVSDGSNPTSLIFPDEQGTYMVDSRSLAGSILSVSKIGFSAYKDSITSPSAPVAGDVIGAVIGKVYETLSASLVTTGGFVLGTDNNETIANDTVKGKMSIVTNGGTGTAPSLKYCTFDASGRLAVNQQDAVATLDVNGFAKLAVLDTAPATPANGMIAIADGDNVSGWDPLGLGSPAKQQMVVYLGGGWRQLAVEP